METAAFVDACGFIYIYILYYAYMSMDRFGRHGWYRCKLKSASLGKRERLHQGRAKCATFSLALSLQVSLLLVIATFSTGLTNLCISHFEVARETVS